MERLAVNVWQWNQTYTHSRWVYVVGYGKYTFTSVYSKPIKATIDSIDPPTKKELRKSIQADARCYQSCSGDILTFMVECGYIERGHDGLDEGAQAFERCRQAAKFVERLQRDYLLDEFNEDDT